MTYYKDKYVKVELSYYELQMIYAIVNNYKNTVEEWFTKDNLKDLNGILKTEVEKLKR